MSHQHTKQEQRAIDQQAARAEKEASKASNIGRCASLGALLPCTERVPSVALALEKDAYLFDPIYSPDVDDLKSLQQGLRQIAINIKSLTDRDLTWVCIPFNYLILIACIDNIACIYTKPIGAGPGCPADPGRIKGNHRVNHLQQPRRICNL